MKLHLRDHKWAVAFCALGGLLTIAWLWSSVAPMRGAIYARADIERGRYQILGYGLPTAWHTASIRCLRERYQIEFNPVAGCVVSERLVSYVNAYDSVVEEATRRKFGRDVIRECSDEARAQWETQHLAAIPNANVTQ